jgi:hypothetical protein
MTTTITIANPWTGAIVERDITGLTQHQLDAYAVVMDSEACEAVARELAPCSPEAFLARYTEIVGAQAAGVVVIGS